MSRGISLDDFRRLTPDEFASVMESSADSEEASRRERWEQTRTLAAYVVSPWMRKGADPKRLLPLPWDKAEMPEAPAVSREEAEARFRKLVAKHYQ